METEGPDRYEPLPALPELPRWLWRRTPRAARIALALALMAAVAGAVAFLPRIQEAQRDARERAQLRAAARKERIARTLAAEQRPILRRTTAPGARPGARERMLATIAAAVLTDARERVDRGALTGTIRRIACEPFPNGSDPAERDPARRRGRYSCVAVTSEFSGGVIGHQYRVLADFTTGRYGFCKITGRAGPERDQPVTIPASCGGEDYGGREGREP